jgi:hypothetical protein
MVETQELVALKNKALEASRFSGNRYRLGAFSVGRAVALWSSSEGGETKLREHGFKVGEYAPWVRWSTSLELAKIHEESRSLEITAFDMDLDSGLVEINHKLITVEQSWKDLIMADFYRNRERKLDMHVLSTEDWQLLYDELERGASGAYTLAELYETG